MENIQVAARVRPLLDKELNHGEIEAFDMNNHVIQLKNEYQKKLAVAKSQFTFDDIFTPDDSNQDVYERKVKRVAMSCLEGYNGTVFMYG